MLLALLLTAGIADWVPARWNSAEPASIGIVRQSPVNCLLLERNNWSPALIEAATRADIATLGVIRPGADVKEIPQQASAAKLTGVVLEGDFDEGQRKPLHAALADSRLTVIELLPRVRMPLDGADPVIGTYQGVWPGINEHEEDAKAAPSGAPWIDTNGGFIRFVRAATKSMVWMGHVPPKGAVVVPARYLQVIDDAAILGARWIVALDPAFEKRLLGGEEKARAEWAAIGNHLRYFEEHKQWRSLRPYTQMAMVQDVETGGLYSGSILDMISVKHTPVLPVPARKLDDERMKGAQLAVNVDPNALNAEQKEVLRRFTRSGGMLLTAAQNWKFPQQRADQITLDKDSVEMLDRIYKEVNTLTYRRNVGARLYNVSSMLSNLLAGPEGKPVILHLVNYSDYPVENITAHVMGKFTKARLLEPGREARDIPVYDHEEGTGADIDKISVMATLVLE